MIEKNFVLSGGGCRGAAHLGAVKALYEQGIYPKALAGTSAGAIACAFLADGFTPDEILDMFVGKLKLNMFSWNGFNLGLISMKKIQEFLEKNLRHHYFNQFKLPLYITATNFLNGRQHIFTEGDAIHAVLAASSIPVIFPPQFIDGIPFVDGGLTNNLPIEPFVDMKNDIVSIYVNPIKEFKEKETVLEIMDRAIHLSFREMVCRSSEGSYLYIEPLELRTFGLFDIHKLSEMFDIGYEYTKTLLNS